MRLHKPTNQRVYLAIKYFRFIKYFVIEERCGTNLKFKQ